MLGLFRKRKKYIGTTTVTRQRYYRGEKNGVDEWEAAVFQYINRKNEVVKMTVEFDGYKKEVSVEAFLDRGVLVVL